VFDFTLDEKPVGGGGVQNSMLIMPYGVGADNAVMSVAVYGWRFVPGRGVDNVDMWVAMLLGWFVCQLSAALPGIGSRVIGSTELFADTITVTYGTPAVNNDVVSPANDLPASILLSLKGCQICELVFGTEGSAISCNALVALL